MSDTFTPEVTGYLYPPFPSEAPYGSALEYNPPATGGAGLRFRFLPPDIFIRLQVSTTGQLRIGLSNYDSAGIVGTLFRLYAADQLHGNPNVYSVLQDSTNSVDYGGSASFVVFEDPVAFLDPPAPGFRWAFDVGSEDLPYNVNFYIAGTASGTAVSSQVMNVSGTFLHS